MDIGKGHVLGKIPYNDFVKDMRSVKLSKSILVRTAPVKIPYRDFRKDMRQVKFHIGVLIKTCAG